MAGEPSPSGTADESNESPQVPLDEMRRLESMRWFQQAQADLKAARDNIGSGNYNWACYMAEQAAEKAVKAVYIFRDLPFRRIHTLAALILGNPDQRIAGVAELASQEKAARGLDAVITSSRYPDAVPAPLAPSDYYDESQADKCVEWAQEIIRAIQELLPAT